jgi:RNA polymerase sigma factor (sigma-70 family)
MERTPPSGEQINNGRPPSQDILARAFSVSPWSHELMQAISDTDTELLGDIFDAFTNYYDALVTTGQHIDEHHGGRTLRLLHESKDSFETLREAGIYRTQNRSASSHYRRFIYSLPVVLAEHLPGFQRRRTDPTDRPINELLNLLYDERRRLSPDARCSAGAADGPLSELIDAALPEDSIEKQDELAALRVHFSSSPLAPPLYAPSRSLHAGLAHLTDMYAYVHRNQAPAAESYVAGLLGLSEHGKPQSLRQLAMHLKHEGGPTLRELEGLVVAELRELLPMMPGASPESQNLLDVDLLVEPIVLEPTDWPEAAPDIPDQRRAAVGEVATGHAIEKSPAPPTPPKTPPKQEPEPKPAPLAEPPEPLAQETVLVPEEFVENRLAHMVLYTMFTTNNPDVRIVPHDIPMVGEWQAKQHIVELLADMYQLDPNHTDPKLAHDANALMRALLNHPDIHVMSGLLLASGLEQTRLPIVAHELQVWFANAIVAGIKKPEGTQIYKMPLGEFYAFIVEKHLAWATKYGSGLQLAPELISEPESAPEPEPESGNALETTAEVASDPMPNPAQENVTGDVIVSVAPATSAKPGKRWDSPEPPAKDPIYIPASIARMMQHRLLESEEELALAKRIEAGLYAAAILTGKQELPDRFTAGMDDAGFDRLLKDLDYIQKDGQRALGIFVTHNARLAGKMARKYLYRTRTMTYEDLFQEGMDAITESIKKFDFKRENKLSTIAVNAVEWQLKRAIAYKDGIVRLPASAYEKISRLAAAHTRLLDETGEEPTYAQLAEATGLTEQQAHDYSPYIKGYLSFDQPVDDLDPGGSKTLGDFIADDTPGPAEVVTLRKDVKDLRQAIATLLPEDRKVILLHYREDLSLTDVAREIGTTRAGAANRINTILRELATTLGADPTAINPIKSRTQAKSAARTKNK